MRKAVQVLAFSILIYWVLSRIREEAEFQRALADRVDAVQAMEDDDEMDITEFSLS